MPNPTTITKTCAKCQSPFEVAQEDLDLFEQISPTFEGKRYQIPPPTLCPPCRQQRRLAFRNERALYKRKCDLSGKDIISTFSPDLPHKVYDQFEWWSDKWDPFEYGQKPDFSRTFAEQFRELYEQVPHISLVNTNCENSYYTNFTLNHKNCHLIFGGANNEDCLYGKFLTDSTDCLDILSCHACELCYEAIKSERCYSCRHIKNCRTCNDCTMCEDCTGCSDCIACFNLKQKSHCILNKQLTEEEYKAELTKYTPLTPEKARELKSQLTELKAPLPHTHAHIYNSEDCTGEYISNCKNCKNSFNARECEDSKYLYFCPKTYNSQDCTFNAPTGPEFSYNLCSTVSLKNSMSNFLFWYGDSAFYSIECHYCNYVFGCTGLKHKQYCILNKQYSKEEYDALVPRIIEHMRRTGEWGEYLAPEISPYAYNETIANEYFPLTKDQAIAQGFTWRNEDEDPPPPAPPKQSTSTCDHTLQCKKSGKLYKIIPQELTFYKRMKIGIPDLCPDQRHYNRMAEFNPLQLWTRQCSKCKTHIETAISPDQPEIVYCEKCYLKEVY